MELHFVRHGQTDFNLTGRLQGLAYDEPINSKGVKEMETLLPLLPDDIQAIYSSPLKRVLASAKMVSEYLHMPIIVKEELAERDFGSLAGKLWSEIPNGLQLQMIDRNQTYDYRPFGGESVQDVTERLTKFCLEVKAEGWKSTLAVTSIGIVRLAYRILRGEDIVQIDNASLHTFVI